MIAGLYGTGNCTASVLGTRYRLKTSSFAELYRLFREALVAKGILTADALAEIDFAIRTEFADAEAFAFVSPFPAPRNSMSEGKHLAWLVEDGAQVDESKVP